MIIVAATATSFHHGDPENTEKSPLFHRTCSCRVGFRDSFFEPVQTMIKTGNDQQGCHFG